MSYSFSAAEDIGGNGVAVDAEEVLGWTAVVGLWITWRAMV